MHAQHVFIENLQPAAPFVNIVFHVFEHFLNTWNDWRGDDDQVLRTNVDVFHLVVGDIRHQGKQRPSLSANENHDVLDLADLRRVDKQMIRNLESDLLEALDALLKLPRVKDELSIVLDTALDDFLDPVNGLRIHADKDPGIVVQVENLVEVFRHLMTWRRVPGPLGAFAFLQKNEHALFAEFGSNRDIAPVVVVQVIIVFDELARIDDVSLRGRDRHPERARVGVRDREEQHLAARDSFLIVALDRVDANARDLLFFSIFMISLAARGDV